MAQITALVTEHNGSRYIQWPLQFDRIKHCTDEDFTNDLSLKLIRKSEPSTIRLDLRAEARPASGRSPIFR